MSAKSGEMVSGCRR